MLTEEQERHLQRTLKAAQSAPGPGLETRAMAAMGEAKPSRRSSRRLLVVSAVAALVLLGFGLTRLPVGSASGLFNGFLAAASQAKTMHMKAAIDDDGIVTIEKWEAPEEHFLRYEHWVADELTVLDLDNGELTVDYWIDPKTGRGTAVEHLDLLGQGAALRGGREPAPTLGPLSVFAEPLDNGKLELIYQGRERNDLGEAVDVVEAEWRPEGTYMMYYSGRPGRGTGLLYEDGERVRIRVEVDPASNLPRTMTHSVEDNGARRTTLDAEFEWNVGIPEAARTFTPPPGSVLKRAHWWERRFPEVVAQGETRDWTVTLHAIDSDRRGWIHLSLSYVYLETAVGPYKSQPPARVEALDSNGERYKQDMNLGNSCGGPGCFYAVIRLIPLGETPQPDSITLTLSNYADSPSEVQSVTFENLPLPPRRPVDDLRAAEIEVIEY